MPLTDQEKEKLDPSNEWIEKVKAEWAYKQKLVVYEDGQGNIITPSTTTTTTTTPKTTQKPVTPKPSSHNTVTVTIQPTKGPVTDSVAQGSTVELIKIVGITCGALVSLILLIMCIVWLCRRSSKKKNQRVSLRRPLHGAEPDVDHIYAEIEPLQAIRNENEAGASGTSAGVRLPKKAKKRRAGVSSFRAISTRIYRFFNMETDDQSVFYNRQGHEVVTGAAAPEPPERNTLNGRTRRGRAVQRGESTASRRPLLDGDSVGSAGPEMRSNIYNPLMKEQGTERQSGPYDHLTPAKTPSDRLKEAEAPPESPHDYFTLENSKAHQSELQGKAASENIGESDTALINLDSVVIENEVDKMDTIEEADEMVETPKHDYFVLEPHEKEYAESEGKRSQNSSPSKASMKSAKSSTKSSGPNSPVKEKYKPDIKPRTTKSSNRNSASSSGPGSPVTEGENPTVKGKAPENSTEKDEVYVLSKLGDAPEPPPEPVVELSEDEESADEYLTPKDVEKAPDYVDVLPEPPPRSSSLPPHETLETLGSPVKKSASTNSPGTSVSPIKSKPRVKGSSPERANSPARATSPTKSTSPAKSSSSKSSRSSSPVKSPSSKSSPVTSHSPAKSDSSKSSQSGSPVKSSSTKSSPVKSPLKTSSSVTTDV